jgi:hypothetical protein
MFHFYLKFVLKMHGGFRFDKYFETYVRLNSQKRAYFFIVYSEFLVLNFDAEWVKRHSAEMQLRLKTKGSLQITIFLFLFSRYYFDMSAICRLT